MPKRTGYSASTWRKLDTAYRKQQRERRAANAARRQARLEDEASKEHSDA